MIASTIATGASSSISACLKGTVKPGDTIRMMATGAEFTLVEVGHMGATSLTPCTQLQAGEVGYLTASIKNVADTRVGDTVTLADRPLRRRCPATVRSSPWCSAASTPADGAKYPDLKDALEKLRLNDASLTFEAETSVALGFGFRCASLAFCIWRSSPSVWNGSLIWTSNT